MDLVRSLSEDDLLIAERVLLGLKLPLEHPVAFLTEEERLARVDAVWGKYASTHTSVDSFVARKHADKLREDERDRRRQAGVA